MTQLLRFSGSAKRDPAIAHWMKAHTGELSQIARHWFEVMRNCGNDVREVLHDGHPTACIADAGFAYVNAFKDHVNVGFFRGAELPDPANQLEGTGRFMRHVKLRPDAGVDAKALTNLIESAYKDMRSRVQAKSRGRDATLGNRKAVDAYLARLNAAQRTALEKLRRDIKAAAPSAKECISYDIPGYRLGSKLLVSFGAGKNHCAFYPGAHPIRAHKRDLAGYDLSIGTIRFPAEEPLPASLVKKLVKARIAEYST